MSGEAGMLRYRSRGEKETAQLGAAIAERLEPGDCITLSGPLGAGKSVLARAVIQHLLGVGVAVSSPSFTLVQPYAVHLQGRPATLLHADLYRIEDASEWDELGIDEAMAAGGCLLLEWPQRIPQAWLPQKRLDIDIAAEPSSGYRIIRLNMNKNWRPQGYGLAEAPLGGWLF